MLRKSVQLPVRLQHHLGITSRFHYHQTSNELLQRKLNTLAGHVVIAPSPENKKKIIEAMVADPALMKAKIPTIIDIPYRRMVRNKTLYQLAYGAGIDDLVKRMKEVFTEHCGSDEAANEAMHAQHHDMLDTPEEHAKKEAVAKDRFEMLLLPIIDAIGKEKQFGSHPMNHDTKAAQTTFQKAFADMLPKEVDKGLHFPYSLMQLAYETHVDTAKEWNFSFRKCVLFENIVIESMLEHMPANDQMITKPGSGAKYTDRTTSDSGWGLVYATRCFVFENREGFDKYLKQKQETCIPYATDLTIERSMSLSLKK